MASASPHGAPCISPRRSRRCCSRRPVRPRRLAPASAASRRPRGFQACGARWSSAARPAWAARRREAPGRRGRVRKKPSGAPEAVAGAPRARRPRRPARCHSARPLSLRCPRGVSSTRARKASGLATLCHARALAAWRIRQGFGLEPMTMAIGECVDLPPTERRHSAKNGSEGSLCRGVAPEALDVPRRALLQERLPARARSFDPCLERLHTDRSVAYRSSAALGTRAAAPRRQRRGGDQQEWGGKKNAPSPAPRRPRPRRRRPRRAARRRS